MTAYRSVSALTLVRGRQVHLDHLVAGLKAQSFPPDELVVAYMQDEPPEVDGSLRFPVKLVQVPGEPMPLAAARNAAASCAQGDILAFLDVDCIPDPDFVTRAGEAMTVDERGVYLPEVRYLPGNATGWLGDDGAPAYDRLLRAGERHPSKKPVAGISTERIEDFGELWGLAFIMASATWKAAGGMDEAYVGYGAEETDFARRLERSGAALYWLGGTLCFHQHHNVHKPPLQHFDSIVRNARLFRSRWGVWCMDYWLGDFAKRGLIATDADTLTVLRHPTEEEIAATRQGDDVLFS